MSQSELKPRLSKGELRIALITTMCCGVFFLCYLYYVIKVTDTKVTWPNADSTKTIPISRSRELGQQIK